MSYIAKSNIQHNGNLYTEGQAVQCNDEDGQILVDSGVAMKSDAVAPAPAAAPVSQPAPAPAQPPTPAAAPAPTAAK